MILGPFGRYGGRGAEELLFALVVLILIAIAVNIPYLLTLQRALQATSPENRRMNPGQVWLLFIPLFNLFWRFQVVSAIADSFEAEARKRGLPLPDPRPTYRTGMPYAVLYLLGTILGYIPFISIIGNLCGLAGLIVWIIYWIKVAEFKNNLNNQMVIPPYDPNYYMQNQQGAAQQYYNQQQYGTQQPYYNQQQQYGQQQNPPQNPNNTNQWAPPQNPNNGNPPPTPPPAQ